MKNTKLSTTNIRCGEFARQKKKFDFSGVYPLPFEIDPNIGKETILVAYDTENILEQMTYGSHLDFTLKAGIFDTDYGVVLFLIHLLWSDNGEGNVYETTVNPDYQIIMDAYTKLSFQTHWHLFLLDIEANVVGIYEIENRFGLDALLIEASHRLTKYTTLDFNKVKSQYQQDYDLEELDKIVLLNISVRATKMQLVH